jgi:hypothetical protein
MVIISVSYSLSFVFDYGLSAILNEEVLWIFSVHLVKLWDITFYKMGTGALTSEVKQPGREADHSLPSTLEANNGGAIYTFTLPHVFMP